ncbi:MAG: hypothetical protein ACQETD_11135, partial [Pseudomonadota bacterium]
QGARVAAAGRVSGAGNESTIFVLSGLDFGAGRCSALSVMHKWCRRRKKGLEVSEYLRIQYAALVRNALKINDIFMMVIR